MGNIAQLISEVAFLLQNLPAIKKLNKMQLITLIGYTLAGASAGLLVHPVNYILVVCGALGGFIAHFHGQIQPSPVATAHAEASVAQVEKAGDAAVAKAHNEHVSNKEAVADFLKDMK